MVKDKPFSNPAMFMTSAALASLAAVPFLALALTGGRQRMPKEPIE